MPSHHRLPTTALTVLVLGAIAVSAGCTKARAANAEGMGMRSPSMTEQLRDRPFQPEHHAVQSSSPMFIPR